MKLSPNFTYAECVKSNTAEQHGIDNTPNAEQLSNMVYLCHNVLEPLRAYFGKPVKVNSMYRSIQTNRLIGGSRTSQHCKGEAVDCEIDGIPNKTIADWVSEHLTFDQIILEFYNPKEGANSGWVHISLRRNGGNRRNKMVALKDGKTTKYKSVSDFDPNNHYNDY